MTALDLPEVMGLKDAADRLGCSTRTLRRAIDAGELRASQLADRGCWALQRTDLLAWLDARATPSARPVIPTTFRGPGTVRSTAGRGRIGPAGPLKSRLTDDMGKAA